METRIENIEHRDLWVCDGFAFTRDDNDNIIKVFVWPLFEEYDTFIDETGNPVAAILSWLKDHNAADDDATICCASCGKNLRMNSEDLSNTTCSFCGGEAK